MNFKILILSMTLVIAPVCFASSEGTNNKIENKAEIRKKRIKLAKGYSAYACGALCVVGSICALGNSFYETFFDRLIPVYNETLSMNTCTPRTWGGPDGYFDLFFRRTVIGTIGSVGFLHCAVKILKYAEKQLEVNDDVK